MQLLLWALHTAHLGIAVFLCFCLTLFDVLQSARLTVIGLCGVFLSAECLRPRLVPDYLISKIWNPGSPEIWQRPFPKAPVSRFFSRRGLWLTWLQVCGWYCAVFGYYALFERRGYIWLLGISARLNTWAVPFLTAAVPLWLLAREELREGRRGGYFTLTLFFAEGACLIAILFIPVLLPMFPDVLPKSAAVFIIVPAVCAGAGALYVKLFFEFAERAAASDFASVQYKYEFLKKAKEGGFDITRLL